jgi:iron complex outermembrane receptor protein
MVRGPVRTAGLLLLILGCAAGLASGQEAPPRFDESVLVTPAASPVTFEVLSRHAFVLHHDAIVRLPALSVAEVLTYATGMDVRTRGPAGVQADFSLRGAGFGQVVVLVNGTRLNDAQTGHHNSDIPVPLVDVERIEVIYGAGSALHGADAVGGTINVITRSGARPPRMTVTVGGDGYVAGDAAVGRQFGSVGLSLAASGSRSSGFMFDRDFATGALSSRARFGASTSVFVGWAKKAFGANGFYGPSPSKEWTDQTLLVVERTFGSAQRTAGPEGPPPHPWGGSLAASYRTHGDRFLWDIRQPGRFENRHRTHAVITTGKLRRGIGGRTTVSVGGELAAEALSSSALGRRDLVRASTFGELQYRFGSRASLVSGLRYDAYSTFGNAWSPSAAVSVWAASETKLRAGVGRTFRVPTFTERFYRDPAHEGTPALDPETGWEVEAGGDHFWRGGWHTTGTVFGRVERGLIDWARPAAEAVWRTANLGRVTTRGVELATRGPASKGHLLGAQYAFVNLDAGDAAALLKYSQDYARHVAAVTASLTLPWRIGLAQRAGYTRRVDGRTATLWDLKLTRPVGRCSVNVEATNLLNERYQETRGVDMPGRWIKAGLVVDLGAR